MSAKKDKAVRDAIQEMVDRIVERFAPEMIILFGSQARGDATADSDVDLLVVMDAPGSKREKQLQIRSALGDIRISKDIIVTRPEDFEWRKEFPGTIERAAVAEGETLYVKGRETQETRHRMGAKSGK